MDSLTQFALGAAVGEAMLGRKLGRRAAVWGGCLGTLPDLDILIPMGNAVADFIYHRSFSHSLIVLALLTPLIAHVAGRIHSGVGITRFRWWVAIYAVFATHVLLDSLTAYGTQIFWPIITTPVSWSSIFIIDPLYTLPLLVGLIFLLCAKRHPHVGHVANRTGLIISTVYLACSIFVKLHVEQRVSREISAQRMNSDAVFTTPTPFNIFLWRAIVMKEDAYYEAYYSVFDGALPMRFKRFSSQTDLVPRIQESWSVQKLEWFTRGFYNVRLENQGIIISDLRMGVEPNYVFRFKVATLINDQVYPTEPELLRPARNFSDLHQVWRRIWEAEADLNF